MPGLSLIFLQLAAAQPSAPAAVTAPDIELNAHVEAREVAVRQDGAAHLSLHAEPGIAPPVKVERSAPPGAKTYRNLKLDLHAEARLTDPKTQQGKTDDSTPP